MQRRTLSLKTLVELGACFDERRVFEEHFGKSVRVTPGLCVRVFDLFNWQWAARNLLSYPAWTEYWRGCDSAWTEYCRVRSTALAEFERVRSTALAECHLGCDTAWAKYERVRSTALAEYKRVCDPLLAECNRVRARTFGEMYNKDA